MVAIAMEKIPLPIPNREVKPICADDTVNTEK